MFHVKTVKLILQKITPSVSVVSMKSFCFMILVMYVYALPYFNPLHILFEVDKVRGVIAARHYHV